MLRFVERMAVARAGPPDGFSHLLSPADAAALLAGRYAHRGSVLRACTWLEYLSEADVDRPGFDAGFKGYLDADRDLPAGMEGTLDLSAAFEAETRWRADGLLALLKAAFPDADIHYVMARRHGFVVGKGVFKLSTRVFFVGLRFATHALLPRVLARLALGGRWNPVVAETGAPFWDESVYKPGDQLLAVFGGIKSAEDRRRLLPARGFDPETDDGYLRFAVQHVDAAWPRVASHHDVADARVRGGESRPLACAAMPVAVRGGLAAYAAFAAPPVVPDTAPQKEKEERRYDVEDGEDGPTPEDAFAALLGCLGAETAACRREWVGVGILAKGMGDGGERYLGAWLAMSAKAGPPPGPGRGYQGRADCLKNWASFKCRLTAAEIVAMSLEEEGGRTTRRAAPAARGGEVGGAQDALITLRSLYKLAMRDDEDAFENWRRRFPDFPNFPDGTGRAGAAWDCSHVVRAARHAVADAATTDDDGTLDARAEGGDVIFVLRDKEYRVGLATLSVAATGTDARTYIHAGAPGVRCGTLVLPKSTAPADGWNMTRPSTTKVHLRSDGPPRTELVLDVKEDEHDVVRVTAIFPDSNKKETLRATKAVLAMIKNVCRDAVSGHLQSVLRVPANVVNNVVFNQCTFVNNAPGPANDEASEFEQVRDALLSHAAERGHRKADGVVYEPVRGCPCAFRAIGSYEEYASAALKDDPTFLRHPRRFDEVIKFMTNYRDLDAMPHHRVNLDIVSFANGVLRLSDGAFMPYAGNDAPVDAVARHHIDGHYDPADMATPLFDRVLLAQLEPEVADLLLALLGRLLFRIGAADRWQVMPYLVGIGGTGKSLILQVADAMFRRGAVGNLGARREEIFGMANLVDKEAVFGRDMPAKLSGALAQELMQAMVAGEAMEVPRKGQVALNVVWTAPIIMASNHMPDYVNTGNNVGRRIVPFRFDKVVAVQDDGLLARILETELPAVVCRATRAYRAAVERAAAAGGFWNAVPPKIREWRGDLAAATSKLHQFLAMDDAERGCTIRRVEGRVTWLPDFVDAFSAKMGTRAGAKDLAVFEELGFRVSDKAVYVCKGCMQLANGRGDRCCVEYTTALRDYKRVIYDMAVEKRWASPDDFLPGGSSATAAMHDTSSAMERAFRERIQVATGIVFHSGVRPEWLRNDVTGQPLELDMFNAELQLAIEYDGPHHYTYPNRYHATIDEFHASQARDVVKDAQCAHRGVTLIRVRAVGDIDDELATCVSAMAAHGFSMRD
jgi:hypothetical protein